MELFRQNRQMRRFANAYSKQTRRKARFISIKVKNSLQATIRGVESDNQNMKRSWFLLLLLIVGCSNDTDSITQTTNNVEAANESANIESETRLVSRYSAISNWENDLPRHGTSSVVLSIDVQRALTTSQPIFIIGHLQDVYLGKTNGITYAVFSQKYKADNIAADPDFVLLSQIQLNDEQTQRLLSDPQKSFSGKYALVVKIFSVESSAAYPSDDDDWPTLFAEGTCVDFSPLK